MLLVHLIRIKITCSTIIQHVWFKFPRNILYIMYVGLINNLTYPCLGLSFGSIYTEQTISNSNFDLKRGIISWIEWCSYVFTTSQNQNLKSEIKMRMIFYYSKVHHDFSE